MTYEQTPIQDQEGNQENPFDLVPYEDMKVPRILLAEGRENHLAAYRKGWDKQRRTMDRAVKPSVKTGNDRTNTLNETRDPKKEKELRALYGWEDAGAAKAWLLGDKNAERETEPRGIDSVMETMRKDTTLIPHGAFPFSDEEYGSDRAVHLTPNNGPENDNRDIENELSDEKFLAS